MRGSVATAWSKQDKSLLPAQHHRGVVTRALRAPAVDHQVDSGNLEGSSLDQVLGTMAQLRHPQVGFPAQLQAAADQHCIDLDAGGAREFEVHRKGTLLVAARQHPASAGQQRAGQYPYRFRWILGTRRSQPQQPAWTILGFVTMAHICLIGMAGHFVSLSRRDTC